MASQLASTDNLPALLHRVRNAFGVTARRGLLGLFDQAIVSGTNFLTTVIIGRYCGAEPLGVYSLGFTLLVLIAVAQESLICVPYNVFGNRMESEDRRRYASSLFGHYLFLASGAVLLLAIGGAMAPSHLQPMVWILIGVAPLTLLREFGRRVSLAHLRLREAVGLDAAVAVLQLGALASLALTGHLTVLNAYLVIATACGLAGVCWLCLCRRRFHVTRAGIRDELRRSWSFGRWVFASQATGVVDSFGLYWLIAAMLDTRATGMFAACMTIVFLANPFIFGVSNVLEPRSARAFATEGAAELSRIVRKVTFLMTLAMGAFVLVVTAGGDLIMQLIYGSDYVGQRSVITLLAFASALIAIAMPARDALRVLERPRWNFVASLAGLVTTFTLGAILIRTSGIAGTAAGFLAGTVVKIIISVAAFRYRIQHA